MPVWSIALTLFLVANPIGNVPALVAIVKDFNFDRQRKILFREGIFSMLITLAFLFVGERFLELIQIQTYALSISGGILLLLVALNMIFPPKSLNNVEKKRQEPFIVPIATPLITGGGVFSTVMIFSAKIQDNLKITLAILLAWTAITAVMVSSAYINRLLGRRGLLALEQLMGMILCMIALEIFVRGLHLFYNVLNSP